MCPAQAHALASLHRSAWHGRCGTGGQRWLGVCWRCLRDSRLCCWRGSLGCCCCVVVVGTLRIWPDDAVVLRGFLWIRPPAMRIHPPVRTRAVKLFNSIRTELCCRAANALFCRAANALLLLPMLLLCGRAASSAVSPRVTHPRPMARVHMSLCVRETHDPVCETLPTGLRTHAGKPALPSLVVGCIACCRGQ